jgi:hypothetical protein
MTNAMLRRATLPLAVLSFWLGGCSALDNCPDGSSAPGDAVVIKGGTTDPDALIYTSSDWEGPRDPFPAKRLMRFEHHLGVTPELVVTYVSFNAEGSDVTENAGNQGRIQCVDDDDIWIKNDTCEEDFFIRVAAYASGATHTACSCTDQFARRCPKE